MNKKQDIDVGALLLQSVREMKAGARARGGYCLNSAQDQSLRFLITTQPLAALGTVQGGEPFVSMVPFAFISNAALPHSGKLIIHVSTLAAHTKQMLENARVSLMVMAAPSPDVPAQATPRVTIQGTAVQIDQSSAEYEEAKAVYLERFPQSLDLFGFADFSLFAIAPTSVRFVAGFAQAMTLSAEDFCKTLSNMHQFINSYASQEPAMRTTLDLPQALIEEAMRLTNIVTKTDVIKAALHNLIQKEKITGLKKYRGKRLVTALTKLARLARSMELHQPNLQTLTKRLGVFAQAL